MNDNYAKILLTIELEGVLGNNSEKREAIPFSVTTFSGDKFNGVKYHFPKEARKCVKKTTISKSAYDHFISGEAPRWMHPKRWAGLSSNERLVLHLNRIAEGREFSFEVLED